jgi:hypothetical protein
VAEEQAAFVNECSVYLSLMDTVHTALLSAQTEIEATRDAQALVYINQAEDLLGEVEEKGEGLRDNRTPEGYLDEMSDLLRAVGIYKSSTKKYRAMVAELPDKGEAYDTAKQAAVFARTEGNTVIVDLKNRVDG